MGVTANFFDYTVSVLLNRAGFTPHTYCTAATTTNGCMPVIATSGTPSASAHSGFTISVSGIEGQKQGLMFYGISGADALPWSVGSSSYLCVKTPTQRSLVQSSGGTANACDGVFTLDFNNYLFTCIG